MTHICQEERCDWFLLAKVFTWPSKAIFSGRLKMLAFPVFLTLFCWFFQVKVFKASFKGFFLPVFTVFPDFHGKTSLE